MFSAVDNEAYLKWDIATLRAAIAALARGARRDTVTVHQTYERLLQSRIGALELEADRTRIDAATSKQHDNSAAQLTATQAFIVKGSEIVERLDEHHATHKRILRWAIVGGVTGVLLVCFDLCHAIHDKNGESEARRISSKLPPEKPSPAAATSAPSKATNQATPLRPMEPSIQDSNAP